MEEEKKRPKYFWEKKGFYIAITTIVGLYLITKLINVVMAGRENMGLYLQLMFVFYFFLAGVIFLIFFKK